MVYNISGKLTNIKYSDKGWFGIGNRSLEYIDIFVYICGIADQFYSIPIEIMKNLADKTPTNSYDNRVGFHIYHQEHLYKAGRNGLIQEDIFKYYQDWSKFGSVSNFSCLIQTSWFQHHTKYF